MDTSHIAKMIEDIKGHIIYMEFQRSNLHQVSATELQARLQDTKKVYRSAHRKSQLRLLEHTNDGIELLGKQQNPQTYKLVINATLFDLRDQLDYLQQRKDLLGGK